MIRAKVLNFDLNYEHLYETNYRSTADSEYIL